jgi:hypothetical protein
LDVASGIWIVRPVAGASTIESDINVRVKLSLKAMIIAGALFKAAVFLFISLMNLVLRPYGGAYLAILSSLYPGYDPVSPLAVIVGTVYSLLAGALGGLLFSYLYNFFGARNS